MACFAFSWARPAQAATLDGVPGTLNAPSAQPMGHLHLAIGLGGYGHSDVSMLADNRFILQPSGVGEPDTNQILDFESGTATLNFALGLGPWFEMAASLPFHGDHIGDTRAEELSGAGLGDPKFSAKVGLALAGDHVLDVAALGAISIPTDNSDGFLPKLDGYVITDSLQENQRFFSAPGNTTELRMLWTADLSRTEARIPFRGHLGYGLQAISASGFEKQILLGGALEWLLQPALGFFGEIETQTRFSRLKGMGSLGDDHSVLGLGFTAEAEDGIFISASLQKTLSRRDFHSFAKAGNGDSTWRYRARILPDLAVSFNMGWTGALIEEDSDQDGVPDLNDPCPREREDRDGFQDNDGCPESDNDQDNVHDAIDRCPNEPEDRDGFQDEDGCAETDNDQDKIADRFDKCPIEAEDKDGFEDYDGCPDLDNDLDGVLDEQDKCIAVAEDKDGFEDGDGCPEADNDRDKIPDAIDKCPAVAETVNGIEDADGCPENGRELPPSPLERRTLLRGVTFQGSGAELAERAYVALDSLAERLRSAPGTYEIRAYMDDAGKRRDLKHVSEAQAAGVRKYLISRGVSPQRLAARGMGSINPIASNHTAKGRAQNRRIELHRTD